MDTDSFVRFLALDLPAHICTHSNPCNVADPASLAMVTFMWHAFMYGAHPLDVLLVETSVC